MSADFWLGVAATFGFSVALNMACAIACLLFFRYEPPTDAP
jgi:hypothetical protein